MLATQFPSDDKALNGAEFSPYKSMWILPPGIDKLQLKGFEMYRVGTLTSHHAIIIQPSSLSLSAPQGSDTVLMIHIRGMQRQRSGVLQFELVPVIEKTFWKPTENVIRFPDKALTWNGLQEMIDQVQKSCRRYDVVYENCQSWTDKMWERLGGSRKLFQTVPGTVDTCVGLGILYGMTCIMPLPVVGLMLLTNYLGQV